MIVQHAYSGQSRVGGGAARTEMVFAPDLHRRPTHFVGELARPLPFREAISALHSVVVSDLRFKPKDRTAWKAWMAEQGDLVNWTEVQGQRRNLNSRVQALQSELAELNRRAADRSRPYLDAQRRYFQYLYEKDREVWFVLDPVITVHPDQVFFECFSEDESSYGRLSVDHSVFRRVGDFACGTTNIDYSSPLYDEFQKIRSYKKTTLTVDPGGFQVRHGNNPDYREEKIDLPDSWVRGFLQVSAAMGLVGEPLVMDPVDVHSLLLALRRRKEKVGPRSLRFQMEPGQPLKVVVEPWFEQLTFPRSPVLSGPAREVRIWGRRRLFILERLLPLARKVSVFLAGNGLPSFWEVDLGELRFTLGLSGWTANDWSRAGHFDLMAPRAQIDPMTAQRVYQSLQKEWRASPEAISRELGLDVPTTLAALLAWTQAGRAVADLGSGLWRARELSGEPLPLERLRFSNEREERARQFVTQRAVNLHSPRVDAEGRVTIQGTVRGEHRIQTCHLILDRDERMVGGECTCSFYAHNKLHKGPCEHILALRVRYHAH